MLQQISQVFSTEHSHAAWDNTSLHKLLSSLDHSQDQLEQTEEGNLDCPFWGTAVREYFQAIHLYLKEKEYSPCAWEIVREETKKRLSFMKHPKWKAWVNKVIFREKDTIDFVKKYFSNGISTFCESSWGLFAIPNMWCLFSYIKVVRAVCH